MKHREPWGSRVCELCPKSHLQDFCENGKKISSKLPDGKKNFLIDIDGTICEDIPKEEPERMADEALYEGALDVCIKCYDEGHIITFFTSRSEEHRAVTEAWLNKHGFRQACLFGKPRGGNYHWIDNHLVRATRYNGKFTEMVERNASIEDLASEVLLRPTGRKPSAYSATDW